MAFEYVIAEVPKELYEEFFANMPEGFNHRNICEIIIATSPKK